MKTQQTETQKGPGKLELLHLKRHCEMCGNTNRKPKSVLEHHRNEFQLEPGFDPAGKPMTLCRPCRIGSAELLDDRREELTKFVDLVARMKPENEFEEGEAPASEDWISTLAATQTRTPCAKCVLGTT